MLQVGSEDVRWDMGWQMAAELLSAIQMLSMPNTAIKRIDADDFKAYWVGDTLRIDIPRSSVT